MRVEKRIDKAARDEADRKAKSDKAFAEEVLGLLQDAYAGRGSSIAGESKAERLACVLTFLMTKVKESLANEAPLAPPDDPRTILAEEAARMFEDIIFNQDKHPIHDFFAGLRKVPKGYPLVDGPAKGGCPTDSLNIHNGLLPVSRTPGLGVMMRLEAHDAAAQVRT